MAGIDLEVIANESPSTFLRCHLMPHPQVSDFRYKLVDSDLRDLVQGFNRLALVIGRARNPQQLGNLDVIQMDFRPAGGKETKLLILHVPTRPGVSVNDIIRTEFAGVELLTVQKPLLKGKTIVAACPYYVKPAMLRPDAREGFATAKTRLGEYVAVARCHLNLGNSERALRIAEAAINSCGENMEAYYVKGQAAENLQRYNAALEAYAAALATG